MKKLRYVLNRQQDYAGRGKGWSQFFMCVPPADDDEKKESDKCFYCAPLVDTPGPCCCFPAEPVDRYNMSEKDIFIDTYGPLVEGYAYYKEGSKFRQVFSHQWGIIVILHQLIFVLISVVTWNMKISFLILAGVEGFYLLILIIVMPYAQRRLFFHNILGALIVIGQLVLLYKFIDNPSWILLLIIASGPLVAILFSAIAVPFIAAKVSGGDDDYSTTITKPLLTSNTASSSNLTSNTASALDMGTVKSNMGGSPDQIEYPNKIRS